MEVTEALAKVGLSTNEVKVYLTLLSLGSSRAGEITNKSGVNRTNVYDALGRLAEKGLVSYVIQANTKYFEASAPDRIVSNLIDEERRIRRRRESIFPVIAELQKRRVLSREPQEATIYVGRKGLKSVAELVLKTKKPLLVFGAEGKFVQLFSHYAQQWHMRRGALRIPLQIVYSASLRKIKSRTQFPMAKKRFNRHVYNTPATTWIFGDLVAIIVWSEQPLVTLIRSRQVSESYRQVFAIMWKDSEP